MFCHRGRTLSLGLALVWHARRGTIYIRYWGSCGSTRAQQFNTDIDNVRTPWGVGSRLHERPATRTSLFMNCLQHGCQSGNIILLLLATRIILATILATTHGTGAGGLCCTQLRYPSSRSRARTSYKCPTTCLTGAPSLERRRFGNRRARLWQRAVLFDYVNH